MSSTTIADTTNKWGAHTRQYVANSEGMLYYWIIENPFKIIPVHTDLNWIWMN